MNDRPESLASFIDRMGLTFDYEEVGEADRPGDPGRWMAGSRHYRCTIERDPEQSEEKTARHSMRVYYSMGPGLTGEPELEDVLDCLAGDIASVQNAGDKWDWMEEMGMVHREGEEAWNTIRRQEKELARMLGPSHLRTLLYDVERL